MALRGRLAFRGGGGRHRGQQLLGIVRLFVGRRRGRHRLRRGCIGGLRLFVRLRIMRVAAVVSVRSDVPRHRLTLASALPCGALLVGGLMLLAARTLVVALALVVALMLLMLAAILAWAAVVALLALGTLALIALALVTLALTTLTLAALALIALALMAVGLISLARTRFVIVLAAGIGHARQALAAGAAGIHRRRQALAHVLHIDVGDRQFTAADARPLALVHRAEDAVIVIGMLQEVFRRDAVAGGAGVAGELQVFLQDLVGIAANPRLVPPAVVTLPLMLAAAAAHAVRFAGATPTRASILVILLHL